MVSPLMNTTCSLDECERAYFAKGMCRRHYKRYNRYGDPFAGGPFRNERILRGGSAKHPLYLTFMGMIHRCGTPSSSFFYLYGGRGIRVCGRWAGVNGFVYFLEDMGAKPTPRHSIDRIDVDGDYEPENCRWATPQQQRANQRRAQPMSAR